MILKGHSDRNQNVKNFFDYSLIRLIIQYGRPLIRRCLKHDNSKAINQNKINDNIFESLQHDLVLDILIFHFKSFLQKL